MTKTVRDGDHGAVLLLYPDALEAAFGSPGFREVYRALAGDGGFTVDWGWYEGKRGSVVYEKRLSRKNYDAVGFSVPWEPLYENVVSALIALGIEPERERRKEGRPIVMVGGAAPTINPVPASVIADIVWQGEAECDLANRLHDILNDMKTGAARKLTPMSGMPVPENEKAAPRFLLPPDLIDSSFLPEFDDPSRSAFAGAGLVEVGRGCSRGCRFCAAGYVYLPSRRRKVGDILADAESYRGAAERIGLVGAAVSDHPRLKEIMEGVIARGFGLTASSFRADMIDDDLARLLVAGGLKTVTIAPEGGSGRIRRILNKRLTRDDILSAAESCARAGIGTIRLYYMIGVPWETEEDVGAVCALTGEIRDIAASHGSRITVSVNPFIPKPRTPFQWCGMAKRSSIEDAYGLLEHEFRRMKGVRYRLMSVRMAIRECIVSLGGEDVGGAIVGHIRDGVPWKKALADNDVDVESLLYREKSSDEIFPWDRFTDPKIKTALRASYDKARRTAQTDTRM